MDIEYSQPSFIQIFTISIEFPKSQTNPYLTSDIHIISLPIAIRYFLCYILSLLKSQIFGKSKALSIGQRLHKIPIRVYRWSTKHIWITCGRSDALVFKVKTLLKDSTKKQLSTIWSHLESCISSKISTDIFR